MSILIYFIFAAVFLVAAAITGYSLYTRKSIPVSLFRDALRNENCGNFEAAILGYENALTEINKSRFPSGKLIQKINGKLKVLRTVTSYEANFHYENTRWPIPDLMHRSFH
ncbi:MAG: hypothetical protein IPP99_03910 [Chitinophagaceae bacterium]|nr:hypothetical protein [Chitinophagaceae bacterium]